MPEFIEETPVSTEQISEDVVEPSLVDEVREEETRQREEAEKPLILGQYKSEAEAKAEFEKLKRDQEDANRRLEEYNNSERIREARAQDLKEQEEADKVKIARSQRSREVRRLAAEYMQAGKIDEAAELMEAYHAQNAAYIAKSMLDEALKPVQEQLKRYQLKEAEEQFMQHPDLQDIKHLSKAAVDLLWEGWAPAKIVHHLRKYNTGESPGVSNTRNENVVSMPDVREQTRRDARSLSPGGSTGGPRRSAIDQEKLLENAQRKRFLEETLGPLPKVAK